ncbi:MAG: tRNA uridine-5-carboxymethylaminomethyl(34) synthesis GTPase MnmE [Deltaproteobacteria bacterium]|nr:tRNA uridine-5-carboxymethylaminomethyl(34) synthesis GTPase MnmE [Candidatus Anaeroferrophillus wilburensis]MBN2889171.1 tRNA uridine-5-carboxymethylaminomethyl(34) synthesis GTPase MnmE [Deltaproteobacteria bacterium]
MITGDTIAAISTPAGEGGIAIVRLSGPCARAILLELFTPVPDPFIPFHLYLGLLHDPQSMKAVDQVLAVWMRAGRSYTREEMVEIHCHGGRLATRKILALVLARGARLAEPGEFTRRAFLHGRLDLVQAEAVADLITAHSEQALAVAATQLAGGLSAVLAAMKETLSRQLAALEVDLDGLAGEGLQSHKISLAVELATLLQRSQALITSYREGRSLVNGLRLVLVGRPNVGKSSLLNALLERERAIVTDVPGTTRDVVSERFELAGIAVELADTAGICDSADPLEQLGIAQTDRWLQQADLAIMVIDQSQPLTVADQRLFQRLTSSRHLVVVNKTDLPAAWSESQIRAWLSHDGPLIPCIAHQRHTNITALKTALLTLIEQEFSQVAGEQVVCHLRQKQQLEKLAVSLERAMTLLETSQPLLDMVADELHQARGALLELTGERRDSDLLETLFANFCVGK